MLKYEKVIFVGTDNTGTSPMAESIFSHMKGQMGVTSCSRGLIVLFPEPVNPKTEEVLKSHGIKLSAAKSRQFSIKEVTDKTLILTMNYQQKYKMMQEYGFKNCIFTLKEYVEELGELTDPYGGTILDYEELYIELSRLIKKTVYKLNEN